MKFSERLVKRKVPSPLPTSCPSSLTPPTHTRELRSAHTFQPNLGDHLPQNTRERSVSVTGRDPVRLLCHLQLESHPPTENTCLAHGFSPHPLIYSFIQQIFGQCSLISVALDTRETAGNKTDGVCVAMVYRAQLGKERKANMCAQRLLGYNTDACHCEILVDGRVCEEAS